MFTNRHDVSSGRRALTNDEVRPPIFDATELQRGFRDELTEPSGNLCIPLDALESVGEVLRIGIRRVQEHGVLRRVGGVDPQSRDGQRAASASSAAATHYEAGRVLERLPTSAARVSRQHEHASVPWNGRSRDDSRGVRHHRQTPNSSGAVRSSIRGISALTHSLQT